MKARVCHISTAHPSNDIRIFEKECQALRKAEYRVILIAPHPKNEVIRGVEIIALTPARSRFARVVKNGFDAWRKALGTRSQIYHFHDPELIPIGLFLSWCKKRVIYDIHEDVPWTILNKEWIPPYLRKSLSSLFRGMENWGARRMSRLIAATPTIRNRFLSIHCKAVDVNNYAMLTEFQRFPNEWNNKEKAVCFVGSMDRNRGIVEMIQAIEKTDGKLILAGTFSPANHRDLVSHLNGWRQVEELGQVNRYEVGGVLARSMAGLVLLHPHPNHVNAQPNKMFEYMSAGLPVIVSHFPLWRKIIEEYNCGLCCDPLKPDEIALTIRWVLDHPEEAKQMGERGRKAVEEKFNWESEKKKLLAVYEELLPSERKEGWS